jgi:molecular chaperone DnaK (HSP70)
VHNEFRLGIDYGTSNTVGVLAWPDGRARPLLFDGSPMLPSSVCAGQDGSLIAGHEAARAARIAPERFEPSPKRRVDELDVLLGDRSYPLGEVFAATLRRVAAEAIRTAGVPIADVTITHPVAWGPARRALLTEAAGRAGLPRPALVPEPVAAASYFVDVLGHRVPVGSSVVVYDLGV